LEIQNFIANRLLALRGEAAEVYERAFTAALAVVPKAHDVHDCPGTSNVTKELATHSIKVSALGPANAGSGGYNCQLA
jgi:hypothetical protein